MAYGDFGEVAPSRQTTPSLKRLKASSSEDKLFYKTHMESDIIDPRIRFYEIIDTNWLLHTLDALDSVHSVPYHRIKDTPEYDFPTPLVANFYRKRKIPILLPRKVIGWVFLPSRILLPIQVKLEIARLHEEGQLHTETSHAKRLCAQMLALPDTCPSGYSVLNRVTDESLLDRFCASMAGMKTLRQPDLTKYPVQVMREKILGPDSLVDKGIISLAHQICKAHPMNHCYVATNDTGIQLEVSHLFNREQLKIGAPNIRHDYAALCVKATADIVRTCGTANDIKGVFL
jgi:hypothetical protein